MNEVVSFIKQYITFAVGFVVVTVVVVFIAVSTRGELLTQQFFDPLRITSSRDEVRIVGIDDASLQSIGAWPWDRSIFAKLTSSLYEHGAKAVVYDVLFLEPRSGDIVFKKVLDDSITPTVLAAKNNNGALLESFLRGGNTRIISSLPQVTPDTDGKVRMYPQGKEIGNVCVDTLAHSAFLIYIHKQFICNESYNSFRYPTSIQTVSVQDVLNNKIPNDFFKNKVIFIGSTALDLEDHFVGMSGEKVSGVYVHASIFTSLLNNVSDRTLTTTETTVLITLYGLLFLLVLYRTKTIITQLLVGTGFIIILITGTLTMFSYGIILPFPWLILVTFLIAGYNALYRFIKERKQNEYISSLFSKYVHKDVLEELMKSSSSLRFDGERREMSILFSDIRGFTSFSETMTPEELTKLLNGYLSAMTPAILEEKGTIDKFIGDAIMAFWNAPLFVEDHTTHAVKAGLRMEHALRLFNTKHKSNLAVGIGIHFGNVIVGNVGSEERVNYTILGDAVNLASRVEGLTKKYGVGLLVTEEAKERVHDANIIFRKLDIITVKGKSKPTVLYEAQTYNKEIKEIFTHYEHAFVHYQNKKWDEAETIFKELESKGDIPSLHMLERIPILKNDPSFDGVWHFDEK